MATRANICIASEHECCWMYRHCDGDPEVTGEPLAYLTRRLLEMPAPVTPERAAGYLAAIGRAEYAAPGYVFDPSADIDMSDSAGEEDGAFETTPGPHGDESWQYLIWLGPGKHYARVTYRPLADEHDALELWPETVRKRLACGDAHGLAFIDERKNPP